MLSKRWIAVVVATPSILRTVLGAFTLILTRAIAEFFGSRLNMPSEALVPTMLAAAAGGVIQAANTRWFFCGGDRRRSPRRACESWKRPLNIDRLCHPVASCRKITNG